MKFAPSLKKKNDQDRLKRWLAGTALGTATMLLHFPLFYIAAGVSAVLLFTNSLLFRVFGHKKSQTEENRYFGTTSGLGLAIAGYALAGILSNNFFNLVANKNDVDHTTNNTATTTEEFITQEKEATPTLEEEVVITELTPLEKVKNLIDNDAFVTLKKVKQQEKPTKKPTKKPTPTEQHSEEKPCETPAYPGAICFYPRTQEEVQAPGKTPETIETPKDPEPKFESYDFTKQAEKLHKRAESGHAQSMKDLAYFLYNGINVKTDKALAYSLYQEAANLGNQQAKTDLAYIQYHGLDGIVTPDKEAAITTMETYTEESSLAQDLYETWTKKSAYPFIEEVTLPAIEAHQCSTQGSTPAGTICFYPKEMYNKEIMLTYNIAAECDYLGTTKDNQTLIGNCSFDNNKNAPKELKAGESLRINNLPDEAKHVRHFEVDERQKGSISVQDFLSSVASPNIQNALTSMNKKAKTFSL